jgi:DNA polymerase epsilon subunit 1
LILQTTKAEVGNAFAYSQYIIKSIKSKPLFHFIDLEIKEYWDYLVWYDEFNYGGKGCQEVIEADEQNLETIMHWQMATFLPVRLQPTFQEWVITFIQLMHSLKRPANSDPDATPRPTQLPNRTGEDEDNQIILGKAYEKPLKKVITGLLSQQKRELLHPELAEDYSFPSLPGSHLAPRGPMLELVKSLMQVLSLDKNITLEARLLRKELLALFEVREFSKEGTFANPSESLKLVQISCDSCTMARDLDLCRDEDLQGNDGRGWQCSFCNTEYDRVAIEERLLGMVEAWTVEWTTQDLKCSRCSALRVNDLMEHCTCSGEWKEMVSRQDVVRKLTVMRKVAKYYGLRMLSDVVEGLFSDL